MGKSFDSLEGLLAYIQEEAIPQVLSTTFADTVEAVAENKTQEDVYDKYQSSYENTGLLKKSWNTTLIGNDTLEMTNTRSDGDRNIPEVIEYGKGYYTKELDERIGARPFIENTRIELESGVARQALKEGLEQILGKGTVV